MPKAFYPKHQGPPKRGAVKCFFSLLGQGVAEKGRERRNYTPATYITVPYKTFFIAPRLLGRLTSKIYTLTKKEYLIHI